MKTSSLISIGIILGLLIGGALLVGCGALVNAPASFSSNNRGGMMGGGMMSGMMQRGGVQSTPTAAPDDDRPVDVTLNVVAQNFRFEPAHVEVKTGQTVRFVITNRDAFAHNFVSAQAGIAERVLASGETQTVVWTAPTRRGVYRALCTYHPNMVLDIEVE